MEKTILDAIAKWLMGCTKSQRTHLETISTQLKYTFPLLSLKEEIEILYRLNNFSLKLKVVIRDLRFFTEMKTQVVVFWVVTLCIMMW